MVVEVEVEDVIYVTELLWSVGTQCTLLLLIHLRLHLILLRLQVLILLLLGVSSLSTPLSFFIIIFISRTWNVEWALNTRSLSTQVESVGRQ